MKLDEIKQARYVLEELKSISRKLNAIDCHICNGYRTERQEKSDNTKEVNLMNRAVELAKRLGLTVFHQSDPRGCSLYLIDGTCTKDYSRGLAV